MKRSYFFLAGLLFTNIIFSQRVDSLRMKHIQDSLTDKAHETEYYTPEPPVILPGANFGDHPSDAIVLFDGKNFIGD